jgi:hypothetical protein
LEKVLNITGIYFTQNRFAEKFGYKNYDRQIGVIAQQIQQFAPEITKPAPFDLDENGNSISGQNYLTVQYEILVPILIQAIKEQQIEIKKLMDDLKEI